MSTKKNLLPVTPLTQKETVPIRLKPSSSDYVTYVKTTANAMGQIEPPSSKTKPSKLLLSLANLDY